MSHHVRTAIITGMACLVGTWIALMLDLSNPYWATMTAWSTTALPGRHLGAGRALRQIVGAALGCMVGYTISLHTEGRPMLQWISIFLLAGGGTYLRFRSAYYYAWSLGTFSSIMLAAMALFDPAVLYSDAYYRAYEIICGVVGVVFAQVPFAWLLDRIFPPPPGPATTEPPTKLDQRDAVHVAMVGAMTVSIVPLIWYAFALGTGTLVMTTIAPLVALDVIFISSPIRTHWRLLGALAGGVVGVMASSVAADSFVVWSALLFAGLAACGWVRGAPYTWSISSMHMGLAFMFAQVTGNSPSSDVSLVINRIIGLMLSLLVMIAVAYYVRLLFQDRPAEEMPNRLSMA